MVYQCELINRPAQPVLSIRTRTPIQNLPQVLGQSYGAIAQYLGTMGQQATGAPFAAYYNMDMQNMDVEIGFPALKVPGKDNIQAGEIPAGKVVSCLHTGPYEACKAAYEAMEQWMKTNGYEATGVVYEFYLNDPAQTPPEQLQTQIVFPLKG
jgi:effector-binding domain-containing protein